MMDVQDVTQASQLACLMPNRRTFLRPAKSPRGRQPPQDTKSREQLIEEFMAHDDKDMVDGEGPTVSGHPYHPSFAPISTLKKICIKQLRLEAHHRGFYLLARVMVPPSRISAVDSLIEDEAGSVTAFSLHNAESRPFAPVVDTLSEGDVVLIKEPWYRCFASGGYGVWVDHPTDAIRLAKHDGRIPSGWQTHRSGNVESPEELRRLGNEAVRTNCLKMALDL